MWQIFKLNEHEFYMARDLAEAKRAAVEHWKYPNVAAAAAAGMFANAHEVPRPELPKIEIVDASGTVGFSARELLEHLVATDPRPQLVAALDE
jgi:hypothetical protein